MDNLRKILNLSGRLNIWRFIIKYVQSWFGHLEFNPYKHDLTAVSTLPSVWYGTNTNMLILRTSDSKRWFNRQIIRRLNNIKYSVTNYPVTERVIWVWNCSIYFLVPCRPGTIVITTIMTITMVVGTMEIDHQDVQLWHHLLKKYQTTDQSLDLLG